MRGKTGPAIGLWLALTVAGAWPIAAQGPIASGALQVQGNRLTLYADELTTDADQTVSLGERARVRTCFGGGGAACGSVLPGDPRIAGLLVQAELRGPEVPQPLPLETLPGGTFLLPGFQQEGDYRLENIRLVDAATGRVLGMAEPSLAVLHVREILLASATVRTLSLEELRARGITFTAENFQAFNFAVGFAFGDEIVEIELPIVYSGYGTVQPLDKPRVILDNLPANIAHEVERWQPPHIVPFKLEREETGALRAGLEEDQDLSLPLFGAIVVPGTVSFLNQFFEARLIVANGAPAGSDARLEEIAGTLRLPQGNVLRVAQTDPAVAPGQAVPVVAANGSRILFPGSQGAAAWTVEGLVAGSYALQMDITATLARPGREPFPLLSRIQAAIEVVDARFNLTFSHPDVVREGEEYSLFVTVSNLSRATQNLVTVDLDEAHMTGAHRADPNDLLRRTIETLAPGQAETLEYRLVAELDGKVVATTFQSTSSAGQGTIRLRTGVGELGISLSPATLILPRFSERLKRPYLPDDDLHRAHTRFLGLAYSLAVAPAAFTPPGLPRVIKTDVERRAIDFAQAGMRTYLHEPLLESLEVLALDYLGNRHPLSEIDELRRGTGKGLAVGTELSRLLRGQQAARNLSARDLFDHFAETTTYTDPYLAALLLPEPGSDGLELAIQGSFEGVVGTLAGAAGTPGAQRTLAFGEVFPVLRNPQGTATVPLALVGHVTLGQELLVTLRNPGGQSAQGTLLLIVPDDDGREDRRFEFIGLTVPAGGTVTVKVGAPVADPRAVDANGVPTGSAPFEQGVQRPPFRLIGAVQDFRLKEDGPDALGNMIRPNRYGNGLLYLFNRPPEKDGAEDPENFRIRSTFNGIDTAGQPASGVSDKRGTGAWVQDDGRTVAVRYATPVSALLVPATGDTLLDHQHLLDTFGLRDAWGEPLDANLPPPTVETQPLHFGGLVTGKVVRGTGEPVAGAKVQLIRGLLWETIVDTVVKLDFLGEMTTGPDGVFFFDFLENPHWDRQVLPGFTLRATIPAGADPELQPEEVQEVSSTVRLQNRALRMNIALLGRGTVTGSVVYADDGSPVAQATVRAASTLFQEQKGVQAKADGSFVIPGVPVGPITLTARDGAGRAVYATVGVAQPGDTVDVLLRMPRIVPGLGTVAGRVVGATSGEAIAGARVAVYSQGASLGSQTTDDFGRFRFDRIPEGQVSLQAAHWAISRVSIFTDLLLAAGETQDVELRLPQGESRTVTGAVFFHDPITNTNVPIQGAVAFIEGPGTFAYTDAAGRYRLEGIPVQGANERYSVKAIDFTRKLEGRVELPPILDVTPDPVEAQSIVLQQMSGGIDGVVLDPLGRPLGGAEVVVYPYGTTTSQPNGSFSFSDLPVRTHNVVAHVGDGLGAGRVGYLGEAAASIVYGGHRPFVSVRLRGSGVVTVHTKTATATGILTPIYYKPTYYSEVEFRIRVKGAYIETSTDPNGHLELVLPVGDYELIAYNPFHGMHTIHGKIDYAGQVVHHEVVFEDAATVEGVVVGVDGVTPVPGVEVILEANGLKGQKQISDPQGRFRYELVPKGRVMVTAEGLAGNVERVGRTIGFVGTAGQTLELQVQMKAQGTVAGRVMENFNGAVRPLAHAFYYLQEDTFPFRRIPAEGAWGVTDALGRYQVPHVYAGAVTVVARDSGQVGRWGSTRGTLTVDWQVLNLPDVVMVTSVGSLRLTVRNPVSGGPVADAQVRLTNNDATVTDSEGVAFFDALPLGTYSIYAFYAPTGQSGRMSNVQLTSPGQGVARTVYLDQRGDVRGTLWSDAAKTVRVEGGVVRLDGQTAGGRVTALATTSSEAGSEGRFEFQGIPEGTFNLEAAHPTTPQRASATAAITATSPVVDLDLVLEPIGDRYFRLFEKKKAGNAPVDLSGGLFSTRLLQGTPPFAAYDFSQLAPEPGTNRFKFPNVLVSRSGGFSAEELTAERRRGGASFSTFTASPPVAGTGTSADPYQVVLGAKGVVRVSVRNAAGQPEAGANVTLNTSGGRFPSVTGADGTVTFAAVPAGALNATASSLALGTSGFATATLTFDDDLIEMTVALAPAVGAHGLIYQPVPNDVWNGDPAQLVPAPGIIVEIRGSKNKTQLVLTDELGTYRFAGLGTGAYVLTARSNNGDQLASTAGTLAGPDGNDNTVAPLILDAAPPRLLSIAPPSGFEGVSRTAAVELVFSEPLLGAVLPVNRANPAPFFSLRTAAGAVAPGTWNSSLDPQGRQVVRFVPTTPYENFTVYSLSVAGGNNGVRDRIGRPLTTSGNVGSNFKTSDSVGPAVIATHPDIARPVDPAVPIRFDFSEALQATDEQLDGDLVGDAAELYWERDTDGAGGSPPEWRRLPIVSFLTRSNYSLVVQAVEGVSLDGDTLKRKIVIAGLLDSHGNVMPVYERTFRIYDERAPRIDAVPFPSAAPTGQLLQGERYVIGPLLAALDDVTPTTPGGDIDRVDYFFEDPTDPTRPVSAAYSAKTFPYSFSFIAAYVGDGTAPRPFPVWVQAVDTSTNPSNVVLASMVVLPNTDPSIETVGVSATAPVPGVPYAGSTLLATVDGFYDLDGSQLTLFAELWQEGAGAPMAATSGKLVTRPAGGWNEAPSQTFTFTLPLDIPEGTPLYVRARVLDSNGSAGLRESERFPVTDDDQPAQVDDFSVRLAGAPVTHLFIGEEFILEIKAHDAETGIQSLVLELDRTDLFPGPISATKVTGTQDLYRTGTLTVPPGMSEPIPVTARVRIDDWGGNQVERTTVFHVGPERDPNAPQARWLLPWQGALWPADYTSTVSSNDGAALLLRFFAQDTNADPDGNPVPGNLVIVQVRGPVRDPETGELVPAAAWTNAVKVPGSDTIAGATYQAMWRVPNGIPVGAEVPFEVRLLDSAGTETIAPVTMTAVAYRQVYEAALTSLAAADPLLAPDGDPDGPVFLLDGTTLSILPQTEGSVRRVSGLFLYTGASNDTGSLVVKPTVLTAPEITSFDSAILYHPFELAVDHEVGVAVGSRIDMTRKGLLGSTSTRSMVLPGETGAQSRAGGSHGGRGWFGSPGGWNRTDLTQPGSVFDSLRDPRLPGGGGGSADANPGGTGGGVIRLLAETARVRLDGDVAANGGNGTGGNSGGGAGGAVKLTARRLEGNGRIQAMGGGGTNFNITGGGGGGRIALSYQELGTGFDPAADVDAAGGINDAPIPSRADRRGGSGTVFVEVVDPETGLPLEPGRLLLENPLEPVRTAATPLPALGDGAVFAVNPDDGIVVLDVPTVRGTLVGDSVVLAATTDGSLLGTFAVVGQARVADASATGGFRIHLTVAATAEELDPAASALVEGVTFHGVSRLLSVDAEASVRLQADDDLLLGPAGAAVLNDRAAILLKRGARAVLRGEAPVVTFTTTPGLSTDVLLGSSVQVAWVVTDPLGLNETKTEHTFAPTPVVQTLFDEQVSVQSAAPTTLQIPIASALSEVSYTVEARNTAGRVTRTTAAWPVLANELPSGQVVLQTGTATPLRAGHPFTVVVQAADRERLLRVTLNVTGPATPVTQTATVTGTAASPTFTLNVPATADGSEPVVLQALIEDASGGSTTTAAFEVPVAANGAPSGTIALAAGAPATIERNQSTTVVVHAEDADGLAKIDLHVSGSPSSVTQPEQTKTLTGNPTATDATFTITATADASPQTLSITATIHDKFGSVSTTAPFTVELVANGAPTGSIALAAGASDRIEPGQSTTVVVQATDPNGLAQIDLHATGAVTQPEQSKTVSGTTVSTSFTLTATADALPQTVTVTATLRDTVGSTAETAAFTFQIVADVDAPVVTITLDPDRGTGLYFAGEVVDVTASATDDVGVASLELTVDGVTTTSTGAPVTYAWTVPDVTGPTPFILTATALDGENNEGTASRTVNTAPVPLDPPPAVSFTCPATGALLPSDYVVALSASASDNAGVTAVRFYLGDETTHFAEVLPAGAPQLTMTASANFDLVTTNGPTVRFRVEATDTAGQTTSRVVDVQLVDVIDLKADGQGSNDWAALEGEIVALRSGTLTLDVPVEVAGLLVLNGARIVHTATSAAASPKSVQITSNGPVYVGCGGSIDVSARGYAAGVTYPGHALPSSENGGSHLGEGGPNHPGPGETYGSVYFPRENGGGGRNAGRGGGAVRLTAARVQVDGAIRANGESQTPAAAGGSIWIDAETLAGVGAVEAKGGSSGCCADGSGGGGAIAIDYQSLDAGSTLLGKLLAQGGATQTQGGAGTVYVKSGTDTFGRLTVDNGTAGGNRRTILPALGKGTAQAGSDGTTLATGRTAAIPAYFVGHWVEVRDGATGALEGTWRVESVEADGKTVTLAPNGSETVTVDAGDAWQGVYRFDRLTVSGSVRLESADPIRVTGEQVIAGPVETSYINAERLVIKPGAVLTQHFTSSVTAPQSLTLEVGELVVEPGGAIDVSGRGFAAGVTYPDHGLPSSENGGSHLGEGGPNHAGPGETFGSVYFPQENGGGGRNAGRGGGAIKIVADRVQLDGTIRANGESTTPAAAGGSVWIKTGALAGTGVIEAKGGNSGCCSDGSGGGGAIAVDYGTLEAGATLLGQLAAQGGSTQTQGGAGTVYVKGGSDPYGELIVDNGSVGGNRRTILPALGGGTAQTGSSGATLVTGRATAIPAYFVGHWVEVRNPAGVLEGTWRVAAVSGFTVTLASNPGEPVTIDTGDAWQGIYRFDRYAVRGQVQVLSADPIRVVAEQVITGVVQTNAIRSGRLVIKPGAVLTQHFTPSAAAPESLTIEVGELVVEAGGAIDVSGRGYPAGVTYPNHGLPASENGGSHLGEGGPNHAGPGETFGSVYFPQENGGGGRNAGRGGGAVKIVAERVQLDGAIRANGESTTPAAAGGSVWIKASALAGVGTIEAKGGSSGCCSDGSGGGGAIAIDYGTLEAGATLLSDLKAQGGSTQTQGGAGTIYVKGGVDAHGELIVDNTGVSGNRRTILPSLGKATAQLGSFGATLVTGRTTAIPPYFVGHWIEVRNPAGVLEGTWRVAAVSGSTVTLASNAGEPVTVDVGDSWQGIYRFDRYTVRGQVQVLSADPIRVLSEQVITGVVQTNAIRSGRLVIKPGAVLTQHFTSSATSPESLTIEVGELVVEAGGAIDVSGRGFAAGVTYPGHGLPANENGGSHLGEGGPNHAGPGETYGSVYFPQENGGGGRNAGRGGGAVKIVAERVQVDGAIRANGESTTPAAAGGSVWIETTTLAGSGVIEAKGGNSGCCADGSGGGGAIAIDYGTLEAGATLLGNLAAPGGATQSQGGAGTVHVKGGSDAYGELIVDNGAVGGNRRTILPSLGKGTAQSGSGGATLVSGRAAAIPPYFVGHWVEVRDGASGLFEGAWRVTSIGLDGRTVTLASNAGEPVTVDEGDSWQGIYRFDRYTVRGQVQVLSADPIRVLAEQVITGVVQTNAIRSGRLVIKPGAVLTQHFTSSAASPESLTIEVGELVVEAGGAIDVSGRGFAAGATYLNHGLPASENGGSHLGEGGPNHAGPGQTFGSVYFPRENGGGGRNASRGGGAVRIVAERVQVDGAIRANGESFTPAAAGGSVWIETSALAGAGVIEARGGNSGCCSDGSGGGGAIAIDYGTLEPGATLLGNLAAPGGSTQTQGGAGTIYLRAGVETYGELIVDNGTVAGNRRTILPALGKGVAQPGSLGATLVTGRATAIPPYFVGHWVEVRNAAGELEGTWRVELISVDGVTVTLASNAGEPVTVDEGDSWQGIYRFDRYTVRGQLQVLSADPIHVFSEQVITGIVQTDSIHAESLVIKPGAVLTQHFTSSAASPESLTIEVNELVVEAGGAIDVSGRGFAAGVTYPGHLLPTSENGGSHLGEGGPNHAGPGETFGSVYFPRENGGGGRNASRGGGAVRIVADRVQVDGAIRANGESFTPAGAGGSVWIRTAALAGSGVIEVKGGNSGCCSDGSGGGGAVSLEYGSLEPASTLLDHLNAQGGSTQSTGGAGTVYLHGPGANLGSLVVDNKTVTGSRRTILPALGRGVVQPGSAGGTVLTGRDASVPGYFVGSWVEVEGPDRFVKGVWRIASVDGTTITLEPRATQPFTIAPGDRWRGIYRFDDVTISTSSILVSTDPVIQLVPPLPAASVAKAAGNKAAGDFEALYGNEQAPTWDKTQIAIAVGTVSGSYRITLGPLAVSDLDGISEVLLTSGGRSLRAEWSEEGATFYWAGRPGQQLHLAATDAHGRFRRTGWQELPPLPEAGWSGQLELADGVTPTAVTGGLDWLAVGDEGVWLYGPGPQPVSVLAPRSADDEVVALTAAGNVVYAATRDRIDRLDRATEVVEEVGLPESMRVVDVVAGTDDAVVLLADDRDPAQPALRLALLTPPSEQAPALSAPSEAALPLLASALLHRTDGFLHLLGTGQDGQGVIYTWPETTPGEPLAATPQIFEVAAGWRATGAWARGAVILDGTAVALLEHGSTGWSEAARIELSAEPTSAAVTGDVLVVVLPGEVQVYDVANSAAPVLLASHPGASWREVEPLAGGEVVLWSPRMAAPPLRWSPSAAVPGNGFLTVIDGLP